MATPVQQNLQAKNAEYVTSFDKGDLVLPPAKQYLVVTCMDARIDPAAAFGISLGDAHVIRNAGGNARDALRSIIISQQLLGTKEILLVKHTDCGMVTFTNEQAHGIVEKNLGVKATVDGKDLDFQPFANGVEDAVVKDIEFLKGNPLLPKEVVVTGWTYDVRTGKVQNIVS